MKAIAFCGLACCVCSENKGCVGCQDGGCESHGWCKNYNCCKEKGLNGCWKCSEFPFTGCMLDKPCIFRKNCASVPEERSAVPLQTEQSSAGLLVTIIYSAIPARKFKTICLGGHSA